MDALAADVRDIMAVGHCSVVLDEFNNINTFGCNKQGQLGDNSEEECRNVPGKLGREFILDQIMMLRGHYDEAISPADRDAGPQAVQSLYEYPSMNNASRAALGSRASGSAVQRSRVTPQPS